MNRRSARQLGGFVLLGQLGRCSASKREEPAEVSVEEVERRNRLDREVDVEVLLVDAGDVACWRTVTAPTAPNPFVALEDLPTSPGKYRLYARIPSTDVDPPVQADLVDAAGTQSSVPVHVDVTTTEANGDASPGLAYRAIGECE